MGFITGGDAGAKEAKAQGGTRSRVRFLTAEAELKDDGDTCIVRPITEQTGWIYGLVHNFVPTKAAPADHKGNWPKMMWAFCQNNKAFIDEDTGAWLPGYGDCYICKAPQYKVKAKYGLVNKTTFRGHGLFCLRDEVKDAQGNVIALQDQLVEIKTGEDRTEKVRNVVLAQMGHGNFFAHFNSAFYGYSTVRDRDFKIRVSGEGKEKDYHPLALDKIVNANGEIHAPGSESWKVYEEACEKQGLSLEKILTEFASKEHYERFFIPVAGEATASTEPEATSPAMPSPEKMDSLRQRIMGHGPAQPDADKSAA